MSRNIKIECSSSDPHDAKFLTESGQEITGIVGANAIFDIEHSNYVTLTCRIDKTNILAVLDDVVFVDGAGNFIMEANVDDYVKLAHYEIYTVPIHELVKSNPVLLQGKHHIVERVIHYTYNEHYKGLKKFADIKLESHEEYVAWYFPTITLAIPEHTCA